MSETYFIRQRRKNNFTILNNTCIKDSKISWKSKGVHTYLMSLPEDWKIFICELVKHSRDGKTALYSAIQELEKHGYIKKLQTRNENGCFSNTVYYVYEEPIGDSLEPHPDYPYSENRDADNRDADNRTQLNTNLPNTDIKKTELTHQHFNENTECVLEGSESVFVQTVKRLFFGEYPFDAKFENEVLTFLEKSAINTPQIEAYLDYVYCRTKKEKVQKSFEGLYHKLALSSSIVRDFKLSSQITSEKAESTVQKLEPCPVCGEPANVFAHCRNCDFDMQDRKNEGMAFKQQQIYRLSSNDKSSYEKEIEHLMAKMQGAGVFLGNPKLKEQFDRELDAIDAKFGIKKLEA